MWYLIVSVTDHCLSFYYDSEHSKTSKPVTTCDPGENSGQDGDMPTL